jgi:hypothetical protein
MRRMTNSEGSAMHSPVTALLDRLSSAKSSRDGWIARCPAHDDRTPSLSIAEGNDGRVLLKCFGGCSTDSVVSALGMTMADLMPPKETRRPKRSIVAEYRYCDADGTHLYSVLRYDPKDFRQRLANGDWKLGDVRRVLYQLPNLAGQEAVWVVEGEKDADRLVKLGVPATCNVGGAGQWRDDYSRQLVMMGVKRAFIIPDNDAPGLAHVQDVARSCAAAGIEARVLELPNLPAKGDVSDWLNSGGTTTTLIALARACPVWAPSTAATSPADRSQEQSTPSRRIHLIRASSIMPRPVKWLWRERIALGSFGLLGGREGIGKSIVGYTLAAAVTNGQLPGDCFGIKRACVIVATEDSKDHTIVPRLMAAGADMDLISFVAVKNSDGTETDLVLPIDVQELERVVREEAAALVVFDPLLSRLEAALDSHKDAEARRALEPMAAIAHATGAAFLGLIHVNKSTSADPLTMLMASRAFAAVARWVLFAMVDPDDEQRRLLGLAKSNLGRTDIPTLAYKIQPCRVADTADGPVWTGRLEWKGEAAGTIRDAIQHTTASGDKTATTEAAEWLTDFLTAAGGSVDSTEVKKAGARAGHTADHLRRARERLRLRTISVGFPRSTRWCLPVESGQPSPTSPTTATTATTGDFSNELIDCSRGTVVAVGAVVRDVACVAATGDHVALGARRQWS